MKRVRKYGADMRVIAEFKPEEILPLTGLGVPPREFEVAGKLYRVRMDSHRYATFRRSGLACVKCGLLGVVMRLECFRNADPTRPHFNLYALREGESILMTKDHIVPCSAGGEDNIENYQTMCTICDGKKGHTLPTPEAVTSDGANWNVIP